MIAAALRRAGLRPALRLLRAELRMGARRLAGTDARIVRRYLASHSPAKLQLGSGANLLPGWLNAQHRPRGRRFPHIDARDPFPVPDSSFDYVFSEHLIEHLPRADADAMLAECRRILRPGGRIRIATPDLEALLALFAPGLDPLQVAYLESSAKRYAIDDAGPATYLNHFLRSWGHEFVYDRATLEAQVREAGFTSLEWHDLGESGDPHLRGLENEGRMPPGHLAYETMCLEAVRP